MIEESASGATLCALLAARWRAAGDGPFDHLRAYTSTQAHSSIEKAVRIAGLRPDQLRLIEVDDDFALRPDALAAAMAEDRAAGLHAVLRRRQRRHHLVDRARSAARRSPTLCAEHGAWLHVDAAHAGSALVCPELRWIADGVERADSFCMNPHKWLFTNFDCDCFWVADRAALIGALTRPARVPAQRGQRVGRRHRLPRLAGAARAPVPVRSSCGSCCAPTAPRGCATTSASTSRSPRAWPTGSHAHPRLEVVAPHPLNLVCFRHVDGDDATEALLARAQRHRPGATSPTPGSTTAT